MINLFKPKKNGDDLELKIDKEQSSRAYCNNNGW